MINLVSFSIRNIFRQRRRTIITTAAMAFAGIIMILYAALLEGLLVSMERNVVAMDLGEIQIHPPGYRSDPDLYTRIENADRLIEEIGGLGLAASPRLYGFGLAASGSASSGIQFRGVDLAREPGVTEIHQHVMRGRWLDASDPQGAVIGRKLSRTLDVSVGDEVVVLSQATDGSIANDLFIVRGVLKAVNEEIDRSGFFMPGPKFRELMVLPEGVHEIAVVRKDRSLDLSEARTQIGWLAPDLSVLDWRQLQPVLARVLELSDVSLITMLLIAYTAVAMVVLNAMLMSVFERIREFGVMKAVGMSPVQVAAVIFCEALIQAAAASLLAVAIGVPLSRYFEIHGIPLSSDESTGTIAGVALDPTLYARLTADAVIEPVVFLMAIAGLAVIYPAIKAAVIRPVEAVRYR
jgi:ABC-type lipoprotein release transport system permease subunit